ncbi:VOC family protein [Novosphingobium sp.]|uniref:VOC family protein n=1 Tax=Novosphingobium sp. TaxID=1874826 RepID=UPI00286E1810|nr:VOC family protein [Novosphingobium sp.]
MIGARAFLLAAALISAPALAGDTPASEAGAVAVMGPMINVGSRDRSVAFYTKGLSMVVQMDMGSDKRHETMLGFAADRTRPGIILLSDLTAKAPASFTHGNAFERIVLRVKNIDGVVARLKSLGYQAGNVRDVAMGYRMAMATDPDGYKLELVESPPHKGMK